MSELPHPKNRIYVVPRDPEALDSTFLFYYLSFAFCQGQMERISKGSTKKHITVADVKGLPLLGILEQQVAVPAASDSRRKRRGSTRSATLGDIARVTTSKPKDLHMVNVLQRVCDPEGTNCGRPYIVIGTAPMHVRSAASRNPDWQRKADTAMRQGRIAFERMRRGAEEVGRDARRARDTAARAMETAQRRLEEQQRRMAFDRIRGAAAAAVRRARILGVDQNRLVQQLASESIEAFEASGYTVSLDQLTAYMEDRLAEIAEEVYDLRMGVRRTTAPGPSFARPRYAEDEMSRASFRVGSRRQQPPPQTGRGSATFRRDEQQRQQRQQWRARQDQGQQQARQQADAARDAQERVRRQQGRSQLDAILDAWGVSAQDRSSKSPEALIKKLRRRSQAEFHPDRFAQDTQAQQEVMKRIFQAANDDLDMLLQFLNDPSTIDFAYRQSPDFSLLDAALENAPTPATAESRSRMLPGMG